MKNYVFISIIIGVISFIASLFLMHSNNPGKVNVDSKIFLYRAENNKMVEMDTLHVKKTVKGIDIVKVESTEIPDSIGYASYSQFSYTAHPNYMVWIVFVSISIAISLAIIPYLFYLIQLVIGKGANWAVLMNRLLLALLSMIVVFFIAQLSSEGRILKITSVIKVLGIMMKTPMLILSIVSSTMLIPNIFCLTGNFSILSKLINKEKIEMGSLVQLHQKYTQFLVISSITLVLGVIGTALLRASILDYLPEEFRFLSPNQFVISYGLIFTFFLIIYYLPGELVFKNRFQDEINELSAKQIEDLGGKVSKVNVYKTGLSLLAPIISSLVLDSLTGIF